ncbi:LysM peptidoglycan-binding domain-containing protein [Ramlibacter alkalitolerans]|uniref:LysM peptidoglycan-binding domain-containing protein n=1 Tax=Ramlibacter alkalitolerans TaxID=2039631 RepID=A0ABS1JPH3_9BURK|nr:LysM peptidoglycan-binding domain-containing protein [Ramlibacter alkalitolerans]MBL0426164.1 LysM peptidoglycan-binding domain-containing protein [Ramlibacter alkalitolerans]
MVAIVSGIRPGLDLSSREVLGQAGMIGNAAEGRNGQGVYVNVANGLLVLQSRDELLVGRGEDAAVVRTYNSAGVFNDDNGDNWASGVVSLQLAGVLNAAGSTISRTERDGSTAVYTFDAVRSLYVSTEGAGAYDTIAYVAADAQFEWRDGGTGATQRFEGTGARRLLSSSDTNGNALSYAYGANGFLSSVSTATGETTFYDYAGNNLSQVRTVAGTVTTTRVRYGYDLSNRLSTVTVDLSPADGSIVDGKTYQTTYSYDGTSKRIASVTQTDGSSLAFTYVEATPGNFKLATVRDALNQTTTFTYGAGLTTVTDALGLATRYSFDASGRLTKIVAPAVTGTTPVQQFGYNANGDVTSVMDGQGRAVTFAYDANGNQVLQRDQAGNTVTRTFDARNQLLTESVYVVPDPDGAGLAEAATPLTTRYVYDAAGRNQLRFVVSDEGRVTEHRYNGFGERIASITYTAALYPTAALAAGAALAEAGVAAWAALQNPAATQRVDFAYDGRGQLQSRTSFASVSATGAGVADGSQSVQAYVHDQAGFLLKTVSAVNGTTSYTYDGLGRVLSTTDALGSVTLTQYADSAGKTVVTLANGLVKTSTYDKAGRLVSVAEGSAAGALLGETKYFYDADNRLRMTQDPTGARTWILYDAAGRKVADVDANGSMTEYAYDGSDRLTYAIDWGNAVDTALLVDLAGQPVTTVTAAALRPLASTSDHATWREYDAAGRLLRLAESSGSGQTAAVTENRYDGASRLLDVVRYATLAPTSGVTGVVKPGAVPAPAASVDDRLTRNFYGDDGLLAGTLDAEGYLTSFKYSAAGQLAETMRYATATAAALRAEGTLAQLTPVANKADLRSVNLYDGKGQLIGAVDAEAYLTEYVYDNNGNQTVSIRYATRVTAAVTTTSSVGAIRPAASPQDRTTSRTYDPLDRLLAETTPEGVRTEYGYDRLGNVVSTVRAALTTEKRTLLAQYDLQGRMVAELSAKGAALLTGGQTQAQVDAIWAQYAKRHTYDAAGRRTSTTDAVGNRTLFFYNVDSALTHTVNALGEVRETVYDARGRAIQQISYANRIATTGLVGGLVPSALTTALAAGANAQLDAKVTFTYTRDDRTATTIDALGNATSFSYNTFGDQVASTQALGDGRNLVQGYTVDHRGLRTAEAADPGGLNAVTSTVYDAFGRAIRTADANGNVREQTFDRLGRVVATRNPLGAAGSRSYDAIGRVLTETDALGNVTAYAYDAVARTVVVTTPEGIRTTTAYTRHGQVQSITDGKGQVTSYTYDADGHLLQTTTPLATTDTATYDAAGRQIETKDARGIKVVYAYDAANRVLTRRLDPTGLNLTTTYAYDGKGQQVTVTDASGIVTTREFDNRGRVLRETVDPGGLELQTVYTYDARDKVLTVTSPAGTVTQYVYDMLGRRVQQRDDPAGLDLTRRWTYDGEGNVVSSTDPLGNITRYAYDAANRLVFTLDPLGNLRQNTYDAAGRVIKTIAYVTPIATIGLAAAPTAAEIQPLIVKLPAQDAVEQRVYDKDGRVVATVDGTGGVVKYGYDANGKVVSRTAYANRITLGTWVVGTVPAPLADAASDDTTQTVYDALDRAIYTIDGVGAVVAQTYDGNGNVLQRTAYGAAIAPTTAATQAAIATAVAAVANPARDALVRNTYDAAGRLTWSADGTGAVTQRVYDKNGNVVRQVAYATAVAASAAPASVLASANDRATAMAYDNANRRVFTVDALRGVTELAYDADGQVVRRTEYAKAIGSIPALGSTGTAAAIRNLVTVNPAADKTTRYGFDAAGRQALVIDPLGAVTETQYNAAGQATAVIAYASVASLVTLPAVPTLAAMKSLVEPDPSADRVTKYAYDAAGRQVYAVDPMGAVTARRYDGAGRLTGTTSYATTLAAATPSNAAGIAAALALVASATLDHVETFTYNAAGWRTSAKDALGASETYTYDALGRKLTFVNKRKFTWTYTYDAAGRMLTETASPVSLTTVTNVAGNLVASAATEVPIVTRLAYDALGNLTQRTEASGLPEQRTTSYEYDALGRQVRVIHPPVGVYNAAGDPLTTNGVAGVASRVETTETLEQRTYYDTLGNAVASVDVGGAVSQRAYDLLGQVVYEVDAMGYVTGHTRNAFGEVTSLKRYAVATSLANATVTAAAQAATKAQVELAINGVGVDHTCDRVLLTTYDRAGRVLEVSEPAVYVYDSSAAAGLQGATTGKRTRNTYDAYGQLVQVSKLRNANTNTWTTTTHYFDAGGRETATVDALGYLSARTFDAFGNVVESTEYENAVAAGYTLSSFAVPLAGDNRTTTFAYDRLNRKTAENRLNVEFSLTANATSTRGTVSTTYAYDAVGNQTRVTDTGGKNTFTYYDALGRVTAVAAPSRTSTVNGAALIPLTEFKRDAYGNVVLKVEYVNGAATGAFTGTAAPSVTTYSVAAADIVADRTTLALYDSFGRSTQSTNANGVNEYTSYDAFGHVAKHWQGVTGNDGRTRTSFEFNAYDKLGQLVETRTPASTSVAALGSISTVAQSVAGVVSTSLEYNAFGELTRKATQGEERQEYFDYDIAGRLWRTNSGDGVDRISLYDALGNATAEIRSSGSGRDNIDMRVFASAQAADANPFTRRTDIQYDALGRVTQRTEAARQELLGGVKVMRQFTSATVIPSASSQVDEANMAISGEVNKVALTWNSLAALGSGDVKVYLEYRTPLVTVTDESNVTSVEGGMVRSITSGIFNGDASASGLTLPWAEISATTNITRMVVYKKDVDGNWQVVVDQAPGYGASEITVAAPPDPGTSVTLQMRAAGSAGDTGWWTAGLVDFGNALRFDGRGLVAGNYEYRVTLTQPNLPARVTGTGTIGITQPPLNTITTPIAYGAAGVGVLAWANPGATYSQVLRYRVNGSTGPWNTLAVALRNNGLSGVDTSGFAAGTYQFELLWTPVGQGVPSAHATGSFTVVAAVPPVGVPPKNLPNIGELWIRSTVVGGTVVFRSDEAGGPVLLGGTTVYMLAWEAAGATVAAWRVPGGVWNYFAIDNTFQSPEGAGYAGAQMAALGGIAPGTYEVLIQAGSPANAQATGLLTISAPVAGHYETRLGVRTASRVVWDDPPAIIISYDESGAPVYYDPPGSWRTEFYTETYSYQVWIDGTTPPPKVTVTTPPYTPGFWTQPIPVRYGVSVTTAPGSVALSTTEGAVASQAAVTNGDNRWLRPTISQKVDRWGNVLEITDPRTAYWKTTYKYNFNNQVVLQTRPDTAGNISASSPVTAIFYDRMGRQVAVKDARGNVNGQVFDAAGNLEREVHADGGVVVNDYNAFGEKTQTTDAMGKLVAFTYDKMGHVLSVAKGTAGVYRIDSGGELVGVTLTNLTERWSYDQLGRKLTQTNGNAEVLSYTYDLRGNVVETRQPLGQVVRAAYDRQGRKTAEVDANGASSSWTYDYFGQLNARVDLDGRHYTYLYDKAGQLTSQTSDRGQNITYGYDAAGQLLTIRDAALDKTTTYAYDLSGRKLRERVVEKGLTYQDNHLAYDAFGNLRDISDARAHIVLEYDAVGNRTRVASYVDYQGTAGETSSSIDRYFKYDAMNRQTTVDAVDALGNLGTQGHQITYDKNGNRTSDRYWGNVVVSSGGAQTIVGFNDESGVAIYATTPVTYTQTAGYTTEEYRYDNLNRLQSVVKDNTQIDVRYYDGADRVVQSGPGGALPLKYAEILNAGLAPDQKNGNETRRNRYDANGRLLHQRVLKSDNSLKADVSWDAGEAYSDGDKTMRADGYDAAGNALSYVTKNYDGGAVTEFTTTLKRYDGYQAAVINGVSSKQLPGSTTQEYDVNGYLFRVTDSTQANNTRSFVNDANGRALFVNQAGNVQRQLIVNGEVLGIYGVGVDAANPSSGNNNNPNFANVVDFDFGYAKISANYPAPGPGAYIVRTGDTLQTIAQAAYGDSSLWYRIAEPNGLMSNSDLKVGQTLNIPNRVSTISNNSSTFKPYDPSKIEGDKTPSLATPEKKGGGCGGLGQILMVIVAVVATVWTAGALSGAVGFVQSMSAGIGVMSGSGAAAATALGTVGTMAVAAGVGSVASQVVGLATGTIDKFDWKGVALSAISAGLSAGVPTSMLSGLGPVGAVVARAALSNALTQGIGVVTGLQKRFDWRGVAASAVAAGASSAAADGLLGETLHISDPAGLESTSIQRAGSAFTDAFRGSELAGRVLAGTIRGTVGGVTAAVANGGRVVVQQIAIDAFGNALGESIAESSNGAPAARGQSEDPLGDFIAKNNNWADVDVPPVAQQQRDALYGWSTGNDGLGFRPTTGVGTVGMRYQGARSPMFDDTRVFSDSVDPNTSANVGQDGRPTAFMPTLPVAVGGVAGGGAAATGGYEVVRPRGAGGAPGYDLVRDMPSGPPALLPGSTSLGLGAPPQQATEKPWFDRAIEGMPIGVKAAAGLMQLITTKVGEALGTTTPARGGTYVLKDEEGNVVRSGRTNDLARREKEHFRNPALWDYTFEEVHRTDDYREQRGLEHKLHETYNPALNKIRPINPSNPRMPDYLDAGDAYLRRQGK